MSAPPWSLKTTLRALAEGWNAFFHDPIDARVCAAVRIIFGALMLIHLAVLYPDLDLWFSEAGVLPREFSKGAVSPFTWSIFDRFPADPSVVQIGFWLSVLHAAALLIGLLPRLNALLLFVWLVSFQTRNSLITDGEDTLMRLLCFCLIWIPSGYCWSANRWLIDRWQSWLGARSANATARGRFAISSWGLRLMQIEMAAMLFSCGLVKLGGTAWIHGTALYYVSRLDDHFGRLPVPAWVFDTPWVVALITWLVLAVEVFVPVFIWFRETRLPCLLIVLAFHLANEWTMNLFLFHWLMICGWLSFLTPGDFAWLHWPRKRGSEDGPRGEVRLCRS